MNRRAMVALVAMGLTLSLQRPAAAADPTEAYLAARDKAIASFSDTSGKAVTDADQAREAAELATLDQMVQALVGPLGLAGFPPTGKSNLTSLMDGTDLGRLDGLTATSLDGRTETIVTTAALFRAWYSQAGTLTADPPPRDVATAFAADDFFFAAFRTDAAVAKAADLPLALTSGIGRAILLQFAQDSVGAHPPDHLGVTMAAGGRVFVFMRPVEIAPIPACQTRLDRLQAEGMALRAKRPVNQAALDDHNRRMDDAYEAATLCVNAAVRKAKNFPDLIRTAQTLADLALSAAR